MNPKKHGFSQPSQPSCLSQLLHGASQQDIRGIGKVNKVDIIYLDFSKAFDKVDHGIFLKKLKKIGINGKVGAWIHNFLSDRQQCVAVNGTSGEAI